MSLANGVHRRTPLCALEEGDPSHLTHFGPVAKRVHSLSADWRTDSLKESYPTLTPGEAYVGLGGERKLWVVSGALSPLRIVARRS